MNVVIICDFAAPIGGAAKVGLSSAIELGKLGHDVHVFAGIGPIEPELQAVARVTCLDLKPFQEFSGMERIRRGIWYAPAGQEFKSFVSGLSPKDTIVHVHSFRDSLSPSPVRAAIDLGFKTVLTAHDYAIGCPYGGFLDHRTDTICHRRGLSASCVMTRCNAGSWLSKGGMMLKQYAQIQRGHVPTGLASVVYVSEFSKQILMEYVPPHVRQVVIPNPISVQKNSPAEVKQNAALVFVGAVSYIKGAHVFLEAATKAGRQAVVVGDGPLKEELSKKFPQADFTGQISAQDVQNRIRQSRAVVFPSLLHETQGMVVYEAMANGIPVVCSDVAAAAYDVKNWNAGLLFKSGDSMDLARVLHQLEDTDLTSRLGAAGYEAFWAEPPTMESHVAGLTKLYKSVLEGDA